ncbi:MAG TPA: alanine--tRNA ligase [Thermohalobaculum sp.]|nr:alanine--tRNA ligase [Thermohalobaculum sp.]
MASLNEIRTAFLEYFARHDHQVVPSSPLVPRNDPTLLFTNAGMVQFKNVFTGLEQRDYQRAVTSQKCLRAGGKHNDLDNVGYTARHHTFFEMLGNFSFGDYFKELAIPLAWDLVTRDFGLARDRLLITVYEDDDEAAAIWKKHTGLPDERILRIAGADNFWSMGPTGPCGPCSEIFYDHGPDIPGGPPGSPDEDGDRFVEIWNLVFMQFEQFEDGRRENLPRPSIDTGMGLERIGAVLQGKHDNFDTDLMRALIEASAHASSSDPDGPHKVHHRVIADHLRATAFLIADGVLPLNEGRGYVLRRIMRRAMRHAHLVGVDRPLMHRLVPVLVQQMGQAYPELIRAQALIAETLEIEEHRFRDTLERGLRLLGEELERLSDAAPLPGEVAFKLYDTYGFPLDLTQDALRELGRTVDLDGFNRAMAEQKARARAAWSGSGDAREEAIWFDLREEIGATDFLGYETERAEGVIGALVRDGKRVGAAKAGETVRMVLNQTPFYAEAGGQVGDQGTLRTAKGRARITDVQRRAESLFVHEALVEEGAIAEGEAAELAVDGARRAKIRANHSATHLMHEALRGRLGEHVAQRGSLVAPDRLRFDFSQPKPMRPDDIAAVEAEVNRYIRQNDRVSTRIMTPEAAEAAGARALFGEKYGDEVRVVAMGRRPPGETGPAGEIYSMELCGGTHVTRTGEIGVFKIVAEGATSAGVRRVEALTGAAALAYLADEERALQEIAAALRVPPREAAGRVKALVDERKALQGEVAELRRRIALGGGEAGAAEPEAKHIKGVKFLARRLEGIDPKDLRGLIDEHKKKLGSGAVLLIAETDGKASVAAGVTDDLTGRLSAIDLVRAAVEAVGGKGGGGRPDMAQGGGPDPSKADEAIRAAEALLEARAAA